MARRFSLPLAFAFSIGVALVAPSALAVTTEPNGVVVPLDSMNGEVQLYSFFQSRGEPIDWQQDAHATPDTFSPLCGFTATYVLNEAGSHFGLAWYNANGQAPQPQDLHMIMAPNSPVGTMITSSDIKKDPAYAGGLVGFALVGGQTHFTESKWDQQCGACNPPGPWISAVIYASKNTANAYYVAFEDGPFTDSGFGNDGDFNDDVFFLTGVTCSGGGEPCDTGKPGMCGPGLTVCTPNGVVCQQLNPAAPMETCNGVDDNCDGNVDEGNPCPTGMVCDKGTCVQQCAGEFPCPAPLVCAQDGYCKTAQCKDVSCPSGQVCVDGQCKAPCDGVVCPYPQTCRANKCVDPCAGVMCQSGEVCEQGVCLPKCDCSPCPMGKTCDSGTGHCAEPSCVGKSCPAMQHCSMGACVDDCMGAVCPSGQKCSMGACVDDPNATGAGGASGAGGSTFDGSSSSSGAGVGGADTSGGNGVTETGVKKKGCACRVGEDSGSSEALFGLALGACAIIARRKRRAG